MSPNEFYDKYRERGDWAQAVADLAIRVRAFDHSASPRQLFGTSPWFATWQDILAAITEVLDEAL